MADDDNRILRKVFKITEVANLSKEERMAYEASLRHKMEWEGAITYATQEAVRKERERAEKEIEQLKAKAIAEKQKAEQNKIRSVERMLLKGLSITDIAEFSDLTVKQVEEINSALQKRK